jgi:hypothetical protein
VGLLLDQPAQPATPSLLSAFHVPLPSEPTDESHRARTKSARVPARLGTPATRVIPKTRSRARKSENGTTRALRPNPVRVQSRCPGPPLLFHVPRPADPIIQPHRAREWETHRQRRAWVDPARGIQKSPRKPRPTFLNKKRLVDFISVEFQYFIQCAS